MKEELIENYGYLFEDELLEEMNEIGVIREVREGSVLIEIDDYIKSIPLLIDGAIKILREDGLGEELVLYYIEKGDTCAMTLSCCVGNAKSEIRAVAETDATLLMIPVEKMTAWMHKYKSWQEFIVQSYHSRLMEMLEAIDTIAFLKMDERLLKYLRDKAMVSHDDMLHVTHNEIAQDLHTSRVVVSRVLKKLEKESRIELFRNKIKVIDL